MDQEVHNGRSFLQMAQGQYSDPEVHNGSLISDQMVHNGQDHTAGLVQARTAAAGGPTAAEDGDQAAMAGGRTGDRMARIGTQALRTTAAKLCLIPRINFVTARHNYATP